MTDFRSYRHTRYAIELIIAVIEEALPDLPEKTRLLLTEAKRAMEKAEKTE